MKALSVSTNNTVSIVDFPTESTFDWARKIIGCEWIEIVRPIGLHGKYVMLVDEEGKLKPHSPNGICSWLYGFEKHGDYIAGNAVIVKEDLVDGEPDIVGMTDAEAETLRTTLKEGVME